MGNKRNKLLRRICTRKRRVSKKSFQKVSRYQEKPTAEVSLTELTPVNPSFTTQKSKTNCDIAGPSLSELTLGNELNMYQLEVETETKSDEPVSGRRLININYFLSELKKKTRHNDLFDCKLDNCVLVGERRLGMMSKFKFHCNMCNKTFYINSDNPLDPERVNVNVAAVTGVISTGIGFSQFEELMSAIDVPVFTKKYYLKLQDDVYEKFEQTAVEAMEEAAKRERDAAIAEGSLKNGIPVIDVYADGCWSTRSYGNNYRALSGAAAIIGHRFGEVLFLAVKNKYCFICARAEKKHVEAQEHKCYKNYEGSSTAMEAEIIAEGFKTSITSYNLIYGRLIADGDSSTYSKILKANPYENIHTVEKIECRNHILRNFCNKMRAVTIDTKYALQHRKTLTNERIMSMRKAIVNSIKYNKEADIQLKAEKIKLLYNDILNALPHAYGDHRNCNDYICNKNKDLENTTLAQIETSTFVFRIRAIIQSIAAKARSLIEDVDTNCAERFNSIVAKFVGGKRINFAQRRSYQARCAAATVSFNCKKSISVIQNAILGRSTKGHWLKIEKRRDVQRKLNRVVIKKKNRQLFKTKPVQYDYGSTCEVPDMRPEEYEKAKDNFLKSLENLTADREIIERSTILQRDSSEWLEIRKNLVTASNFGQICKRKKKLNTAPLVKNILYKKNISHVASVAHGLENEKIALQQLAQQQGLHIKACGLFIDKKYPFIGATPDGLIGDDTIVEVKCPIVAFKKGMDVALQENKIQLYKLNKKTGSIEINKICNWYYQVQGQLHVTSRKKCLFGIYAGPNVPLKIEYIEKDDDFWSQKMEKKLILFYEKCLLPEIIDPRFTRGMPLRNINLLDDSKENIHLPQTSSEISHKPSPTLRVLDFSEF